MAGNNSIDVALRAAEQIKDKESTSSSSARLKVNEEDLGPIDSLRHTILSHVLSENYSRGIDELNGYLESKSDFPQFRERAERYIRYSCDLVNAIKAKRSFPGKGQLPMAKQQELYDRAMEHVNELKGTLRKIEKIERQMRLEDIRSTVWVVKALVYCVFAVLVLAFLREISRGLLPSAIVVLDGTFGDMTNWMFDQLGL